MSLLVRAGLLTGIPLVLMTAIGTALIAQGKPADGRSTFATGVIISAVAGASVIYQIDRWSLPKQSVTHFGIMAATVLPALFLSGWFRLESVWDYAVVIGIFLLVGALLWAALFLVFTKLVPSG